MVHTKQSLEELYRNTLETLGNDWSSFLEFSANHYKLSFENQVLLYAQRPHATAVTTLDIWNQNYQRRVNKGSEAAKQFDATVYKGYTAKLFDISQTSGKEVDFVWDDNRLLRILGDSSNKIINNMIDRSLSQESSKSMILENSLRYSVSHKCKVSYPMHFEKLSKNSVEKIGRDIVKYNYQILRQIEKELKDERARISNDKRNQRDNVPISIHQGRDTDIRHVRGERRGGEFERVGGRPNEHSTIREVSTRELGKNIPKIFGEPIPRNLGGSERGVGGLPVEDDRRDLLGRVLEHEEQLSFTESKQNPTGIYGEGETPRPDGYEVSGDSDIEHVGEMEDKRGGIEQPLTQTKLIDSDDEKAVLEQTAFFDFQANEEYQTPKTVLGRFNANIDAIKTMQKIVSEKRGASPDEQIVLSKYVGWGGSSQVFDPKSSAYDPRYGELETLLSAEEYDCAKSSTLTSFYTNPMIVKWIYDVVGDFGFDGGRILEPSMGVGNFISNMPSEIKKNSQITGVEIDKLTGEIAKLLYPKSNVLVCGFEDSNVEDNSFDVAISNIPFGNHKIYEKKYGNQNIHDYFFMKSLDSVRPGGLVKEKIETDIELSRLNTLKSSFIRQKYSIQHQVERQFPEKIAEYQKKITECEKDIVARKPKALGDDFRIKINGTTYTNKEDAGNMIIGFLNSCKGKNDSYVLGEYRGMSLSGCWDTFSDIPYLSIKGNAAYKIEASSLSGLGNIIRLDNCIDGIENDLNRTEVKLLETKNSLEDLTKQLDSKFEYAEQLEKLTARQLEITSLLNKVDTMDEQLQNIPESPVAMKPIELDIPKPQLEKRQTMAQVIEH